MGAITVMNKWWAIITMIALFMAAVCAHMFFHCAYCTTNKVVYVFFGFFFLGFGIASGIRMMKRG